MGGRRSRKIWRMVYEAKARRVSVFLLSFQKFKILISLCSLDYLIRIFPSSLLENSSSPLGSEPILTSIYASLPLDIFKLCIESVDLPVSSVQSRFSLAKKVITLRKKRGTMGNMEEAVVLAIKGGENEAAVHITRKPKRRSALWKVEG